MRLDRWLVSLGVGSRSQVQKLIRSGAVQVDGQPARDPARSFQGIEPLTLRGEPLDGRLTRHIMLHKPAGLLTAARDHKQPTVMDLLPPACPALGCMPVGRLDKDTTGLLLLTTDGELNHRLLAPIGLIHLVINAGRSCDKVEIKLALQPLLYYLHMEQSQKSTTEAKAERGRVFLLEKERRVVKF